MVLLMVASEKKAEAKGEPQAGACAEAAPEQPSHGTCEARIQKKFGEPIIVDEIDARRINALLHEYKDQWISDAGYAQAKANTGSWMSIGPHACKEWERNSIGRLHIYQNGVKIHDILLTWDGNLCKDEDVPDKHQYLWLHWGDPLSEIITKYTVGKKEGASSVTLLQGWEGRSIYEKDPGFKKDVLENGLFAQKHRLLKYIWKHKKDEQDGIDMVCGLGEFIVGTSAHIEKILIDSKDPAACLDVLRLAAKAQLEGGDSRAQYELGMLYLKGEGVVTRCQDKAEEWLSKAAAAGILEAQNALMILKDEKSGSTTTIEQES